MSKKKDNLMSMMSIFGIILVVLGHSGYEGTNIAVDCPYLFKWIYNFHMPLFFFISGYLFSLTNESFIEMNKPKLIRKKIQRLLVPYLTIGLVLWGIKFIFSSYASVERSFSVTTFLLMFVAPSMEGSTMGYLWYLITLFVVFALIAIFSMVHIDMKKSSWCLIVIGGSWLLNSWFGTIEWFNIGQVLWYMPFFVIGILYKKYDAILKQKINWGGIFNVSLSVTLSVLLILINTNSQPFVYKIVAAVVGIWVSLSVCSYLARKEWIIKNILPYGDYTYSIYLLSWFGQYSTKIIVVNILHLNMIVSIVSLFFMGIVVPILIDKTIGKFDCNYKCKWLRMIVGY